MTLTINNLHVEVEGKEIIKGITRTFSPGKVHVIMGPNGAGKSSLFKAMIGHPKYSITNGTINIDGEDITSLPADEKAKKGLFLSFQHPVEIPGVRLGHFLRTAYNAQHPDAQLGVLDFAKLLTEKRELLGISKEFVKRSLNDGFSGGEKKRAEMLQLLVLQPKYALLDETDSGLDVDAIKQVAEQIKIVQQESNMSIIVITHYKRFLDFLEPDTVAVMDKGQIVMEGDAALAEKIEKKGFGGIE